MFWSDSFPETLLSELMIGWPLSSFFFLFNLCLAVSHEWTERVSDSFFLLNLLQFLWAITYRQN